MIEPVVETPAAVAECGPERVLVIADYHAGLEMGLRDVGVELRSHAATRREAVLTILGRTDVDRVVFLGDVGHRIGAPHGPERDELESLFTAVADQIPVTVTKGNHDGNLEEIAADLADVTVEPTTGVRIGDVGFCHGHTWPAEAVLAAPLLCTGHEHPLVRLADDVGGTRTERVWLRGALDPAGFPDYDAVGERLVVCPAFNDLSSGTVVNEADTFLSPFLPDGLESGEAFLVDGTRLGEYQSV